MEPILIIVLVVVAILNLILFFKVWGMTNNTIKIRAFLEAQRPDLVWNEGSAGVLSDYLPARYEEKKETKK